MSGTPNAVGRHALGLVKVTRMVIQPDPGFAPVVTTAPVTMHMATLGAAAPAATGAATGAGRSSRFTRPGTRPKAPAPPVSPHPVETSQPVETLQPVGKATKRTPKRTIVRVAGVKMWPMW